MTDVERAEIKKLRCAGLGYKAVSSALGLPLNTVKSYYRRNLVEREIQLCSHCGKTIVSHRSGQRFCSEKCRMAWWMNHPEQLTRAADYVHTCEKCRKQFVSHKRQSRFCSRTCYAEARRSV